MKQLCLFLIVIITMLSCIQQTQKGKEHKYKVHTYTSKQKNSTETTDDDLLYWYIIWSNNNSSSYYYSSSTPVTSFKTVQFNYASNVRALPVEKDQLEEQNEQEINQEEFSEEMNEALETNDVEFSESIENTEMA